MRNFLTFAGRDSRDFGVYISGQGTFSAPKKAYAFYNVPGRNGAILGNDHRLENIEVSYECFIYKDFSKNIADFRTFLLSCDGYQKLTDSYHTDEYRSAVYEGAFEPEVTAKNDAGSFTLTFSCKPQRWLISGDTVYAWVPGGSQDIVGQMVDVYWPAVDPSVLTAEFSYAGGYANYYYLYCNGETVVTIPFPQGEVAGAQIDFIAGEWKLTRRRLHPTAAFSYVHIVSANHDVFKSSSTYSSMVSFYGGDIFSIADDVRSYMYVTPESTEYATADKLGGYSKAWTVFDDHLYIQDLEHQALSGSSFAQYLTESGYFYIDLANPTVTTFTPFSPEAFEWVTYSVSAGVLKMRYYSDADKMSNPTEFPSLPLIRVYGTGSFTINGITITISDCTNYVDIDCDLMDCYEGNVNRNKDVTFSSYDFPTLQPGRNEIDNIVGLTSIEITPRWWRV